MLILCDQRFLVDVLILLPCATIYAGAALATLDAVYLHGQLPSSTSFKTVTFGQPRVGNQAFADYVDHNTPITHITNKKDPVPIIPARNLGYVHPSGEIHIAEGTWSPCPGKHPLHLSRYGLSMYRLKTGQENESKSCSDGAVPNVSDAVEADHDGPYSGIMLGRC